MSTVATRDFPANPVVRAEAKDRRRRTTKDKVSESSNRSVAAASEAPKEERMRRAPAKRVKKEPTEGQPATGSGSASRLVQPSPTGSAPPPPARPVDRDFNEGVAKAPMRLTSNSGALYRGPADLRSFGPRPGGPIGPGGLHSGLGHWPKTMHNDCEPPMSSRAPPLISGTKRSFSPGPDSRSLDMRHSRVGSIGSMPGHGNSALTSLAYPFPSATNVAFTRGPSDWGAELPSHLWLAGADGEGLSDMQARLRTPGNPPSLTVSEFEVEQPHHVKSGAPSHEDEPAFNTDISGAA
ncbi:uncharacterized protein B0H18DRAFT_957064 [Fomitopsis serialis]|uniref:uncharacterized protein n=1 Tax=Fomitopsis serialis TaxID=139415 RepID=UPI002008AD42|nr:uncharacterized protein B0H18DRAFT_957064 [Neoantrodia serialis]KAH9920477.1 hypothetical protein B0H18DRAFT_957064 [Neoantrodia serialis]